MKPVESPEKELRFTRAHQAVMFWIFGALSAAASITLTVITSYRDENPDLPHPLWVLLPLGVATLIFRLAVRLTRHAYLILTPLGLEIFPLWKPEKSMRVVFWHEIAAVDFDDKLTRMIVHHDAEKTSGIHLSLRPIPQPQRGLLEKAMRERVAQQVD